MISHEDLLKTQIGINPIDGATFTYTFETNFQDAKLLFAQHAVNAEFVNVLRACNLMYMRLQADFDLLQGLIDRFEAVGGDKMAHLLLQHQGSIKIIQDAAINGSFQVKTT